MKDDGNYFTFYNFHLKFIIQQGHDYQSKEYER